MTWLCPSFLLSTDFAFAQFMSTFSARKPLAPRTKIDFTTKSLKIVEFYYEKCSVGTSFRRKGRIADARINWSRYRLPVFVPY